MRRRPGYAEIVSTLCLIALLAGGTAVASHLVVDSSDVVDGTISYLDVADTSLAGVDLANGTIGASDVANGAVDATKLWRDPWLNLPLDTGMVPPAVPGYDAPAFRRDGWDTVSLKGRVVGYAASAQCPAQAASALLPRDYRPAFRHAFNVRSSAGPWRVDVWASGRITWEQVPRNSYEPCPWVSFDGIGFRTP